MACFWFSLVLLTSLSISPFLSSSAGLNSQASSTTVSGSLALLTNSQPLSPVKELSPDIAPLLPSPGGVLPSPSVSSLPTIPSNPSPPNPDDLVAPGSDSVIPPVGSPLAGSAASQNLVNLVVVVGLAACSLTQLF